MPYIVFTKKIKKIKKSNPFQLPITVILNTHSVAYSSADEKKNHLLLARLHHKYGIIRFL